MLVLVCSPPLLVTARYTAVITPPTIWKTLPLDPLVGLKLVLKKRRVARMSLLLPPAEPQINTTFVNELTPVHRLPPNPEAVTTTKPQKYRVKLCTVGIWGAEF